MPSANTNTCLVKAVLMLGYRGDLCQKSRPFCVSNITVFMKDYLNSWLWHSSDKRSWVFKSDLWIRQPSDEVSPSNCSEVPA